MPKDIARVATCGPNKTLVPDAVNRWPMANPRFPPKLVGALRLS